MATYTITHLERCTLDDLTGLLNRVEDGQLHDLDKLDAQTGDGQKLLELMRRLKRAEDTLQMIREFASMHSSVTSPADQGWGG